MAKILITTLPHEGHLNPTFGIASELCKRDHAVEYLGHPLINNKIKEQGFSYLENRIMKFSDIGMLINILLLQKSRGKREMKLAIKLFTSRLIPQVEHVEKLIKCFKPDIIVNDAFHYASALAAEKYNLPWVDCWTAGILHPDANPYIAPIEKEYLFKLMAMFDRRINGARARLGLPAKQAGSFLTPSPWLQLYTSCIEIEPGVPEIGSTAVFIGPCIGDRKEQWLDIDGLFQAKAKELPLIYVSFGTFFNRDKKCINKLIKLASRLNVRMIISTPLAEALQKSLSVDTNVVLKERVPQRQVLDQAKLFITHGGNNSVQEALAAGTPMLVTPVAGEQQYNAERVRWLKVGDRIEVRKASVNEIAEIVNRLLKNEQVRINASDIKQHLARYNAPEKAANLIESILLTRRPYSTN